MRLVRNPGFALRRRHTQFCVTIATATRIMRATRMTNRFQLEQDSPAPVLRRLGRFDWWLAVSGQNQNWISRLARPEQLLLPPAQPLKQFIAGREVVRTRLDDESIGDIVVKRFTPRGFTETIKWSWRESRAVRAFHLARRIARLGFFTALPLAAGERHRWGLLRESFLLTRFIPNATPLHLVNSRCADRRRRSGIVRKLARLYAALHDAGFCHRDPSQANFLVVEQPDASDTIALIDLDGLRRQRGMSLTDSAADLRRLLSRGFIPRSERAWFIVTYSHSRNAPVNARELLKLIGPLPAQATFPHCALDEDSQPASR